MYSLEQKIDIINRILEINELKSQFSGCRKATDYVDSNGRLHFTVNQLGYDGTARIYTRDFAVNQLSRPMRECVLPNDGNKFLYFDLSAAELYILAYWSKCTEMLSWFNNGLDVHSEVMKRLFDKESVTKEERSVSKVLSFATVYGGNAFTIARDLKCSEEEGEDFQRRYRELFPEFGQFTNKMIEYAEHNGATKTIFNRFRKLPDIWSQDSEVRRKVEHQVINTAIQGSCADFLKEMTNNLRTKYPYPCRMQVFDSMLIEVPKNFTDEQAVALIDDLVNFDYKFPGFKFRYDWSFGNNWREAQEGC